MSTTLIIFKNHLVNFSHTLHKVSLSKVIILPQRRSYINNIMLSLLNFLQKQCWNGYSFALAYLKQVTLAQQQCICGPLSCCYPVIPVVIPLTGNSRWRPVPTWRRMFPGYVWQSRTDSWLPREGQRSKVDLKISPYSFFVCYKIVYIWNQFS